MSEFRVEYISNSGFSFKHVLTPTSDMHKRSVSTTHSHPTFEIYYLINGNVNLHVSGQTYRIQRGDIVILNAYENHYVEVNPNEDYERYVVEFILDNIPTIKGITPLYDFFYVHPPIAFLKKDIVKETNILNVLKDMEEISSHPHKYTNHLLSSDIAKLVSLIAYHLEANDDQAEDISNIVSQTDVYIHKTIQYINANIQNKITIDDVAENVHLSKSYLQHIFKNKLGIAISEYIFKQKMNCAKFMLSSGKSLSETANALGYTYYSTFSAHYKKLFGVAPKNHSH